MDRSDERNDKVGDVLGLGNITSEPTDIRRPSEEEEIEDSEQPRRDERVKKGADRILSGIEESPRHSGAAGTDMGAGRKGADIEE